MPLALQLSLQAGGELAWPKTGATTSLLGTSQSGSFNGKWLESLRSCAGASVLSACCGSGNVGRDVSRGRLTLSTLGDRVALERHVGGRAAVMGFFVKGSIPNSFQPSFFSNTDRCFPGVGEGFSVILWMVAKSVRTA